MGRQLAPFVLLACWIALLFQAHAGFITENYPIFPAHEFTPIDGPNAVKMPDHVKFFQHPVHGQVAIKSFTSNYHIGHAEMMALELVEREGVPNVVKLYGAFMTADRKIMMLVTKVAGIRTLEQALQPDQPPFSEAVARKIVRALLETQAQLLRIRRIHGDIKPDNILLDKDDNPILIDFGLFQNEYQRPMAMAPAIYSAPELNQGRIYFASDVWMIGVVMFCILEHKPKGPFAKEHFVAPTSPSLEWRRRNVVGFCATMQSTLYEKMSPVARDLNQKLLAYVYSHRPIAETALQHEWFKEPAAAAPPKRRASLRRSNTGASARRRQSTARRA